jgi:hypothetical protein
MSLPTTNSAWHARAWAVSFCAAIDRARSTVPLASDSSHWKLVTSLVTCQT